MKITATSSLPRQRVSSAPCVRGKNLWVGDAIGEATAAVVCLAISPDYEQDTTIYAGTSRGVYKSGDEGLTWKNNNEGLDNKAIVSLLVSPNYATDHGVYAVSLGGTIMAVRRCVDDCSFLNLFKGALHREALHRDVGALYFGMNEKLRADKVGT